MPSDGPAMTEEPASVAGPQGLADASVDGTPLLSLRENAIAKEPGPDILSLGGVCFGSLLQGWPRLL